MKFRKKRISILIATISVITPVMIAETHVDWQNLGTPDGEKDKHFIQRFTVTGDTDLRGIAFNMFKRKMQPVNPVDTLTEIIPGYYLLTSPRFGQNADTLVFDIDTRGFFSTSSYTPDGFHGITRDNKAVPVVMTRQKFTEPKLYHAFEANKYRRAADLYRFNDSLKTDWQPGVYDIIPSFKKVDFIPEGKTVSNPVVKYDISEQYSIDGRPEHAVIEVKDGMVTVKAANERAARGAARVFEAKVLRNNENPLPEATLIYDPDLEWRGVMIDIARNFQSLEALKDVLNLMADNGLNKLHFHAVDDEAWRLEMPSLPELTAVGSRRGWGLDESDHLYQLFTGDGNPDNMSGTSNGHYTRAQIIDLLKTAYDLGIDVVPEIESPGHARAAIKSMEVRAANGDPSFRLISDGDDSKYTSAQSLHDNVMNPALETTYNFMTVVFDDIIDIYKEAGVPLTGIHIGGDEVPRGAWDGSPVVREFMKANNIANQKEMHAYFVRRLAKILSERNVPVYGWQEIALGHGEEYDNDIAPLVGGVNAWSTIIKQGETPVPVLAVTSGYPTILSNVEHFYFDLSYTEHPAEPGLRWGGHVNEFTAFDGYADKLCPAPADAKGYIKGVNAQLFAETLRNPTQMLMYLTPKIFGLAERGANRDKTYTVEQFNAIIGEKELPAMEKRFNANKAGVVHVNQPGIIVSDGQIFMNAPYTGGEIRYTLDGSEPDAESVIYTGPFPADGVKEIRARYYRNGGESVTTYLTL